MDQQRKEQVIDMKFQPVTALQQGTDAAAVIVKADQAFQIPEPVLEEKFRKLVPEEMAVGHLQCREMRLPDGLTLLLIGYDEQSVQPLDSLRAVLRLAADRLLAMNAGHALLCSDPSLSSAAALQTGVVFSEQLYRFNRYRTKPQKVSLHSLDFLGTCADELAEGAVLGECVNLARDLVNEPADVLTPDELARRCHTYGSLYGFSVEVLEEAQCRALGMNLYLAVAQGSRLPPRFIIMRYHGSESDPLALIGKGITYDTGGLHIKTSGMESMRFDMNGAAAVIGAMAAIAARRLPCHVVGVVAACENAVGPGSYRNGDIIKSMHGKTVFVRNTDAEGRLTMADAMTYCCQYVHPEKMIAAAGLTGSVCSFYGNVAAAALTTRQEMFDLLVSASAVTGEKFVQMPVFEEYRAKLKTGYADIDNAPAGDCSGILAELFLDSFSMDIPFLHIDFGAMPFTNSPPPGQEIGATGFGVKSLYWFAKNSC